MTCNCKDHGGCKSEVKPPYRTCYICYYGHKIDERDNSPLDGSDEIGYQKGESVDWENLEWLDQDQKENAVTGN